MSTQPGSSALDAATQAFPVLTTAQIDRIRHAGRVRIVQRGEILFQPNDTDVPFFVVLSGGMEIVQPTLDGERPIAAHGPGAFTGELTMISGQGALVRGRVTEPGEFLELTGEALRSLVAKDAELSEILMRAFILRRLALISHGYGNVILMGSRHSAQTLHLREFLSRNGHPYTYIDLDTDLSSQALLDRFAVKATEVPVVICNGRDVLRSPSIQRLANCLGLNDGVDGTHVRDVIVVGAGPAGLAAAVYAASEGLNVLVIETSAPGGQAGSSSKIENYLGFPMGISGQELASRAATQARKFGANMMIARSVVRLDCDLRPYRVFLDCGDPLATRSIVIATGAQYNKPRLENLEKFEGEGVYYGATFIESQMCESDEVAVVGGANSAGQAAVYFSGYAARVTMLVRGESLAKSMSHYLIEQIGAIDNIDVRTRTEVVEAVGESGHLSALRLHNADDGSEQEIPVDACFVFIGALPRTEWLAGVVARDDRGFVLAGSDVPRQGWPLAREPHPLETSVPGVFVAGDVRSRSIKRVASAVGEGSMAVSLIHEYLAQG